MSLPILQTPWFNNIGNCAEELFYGLLRARREQKRVLFLYPRLFFGRWGIKVANRELFRLDLPYSYPAKHPLAFFGGWFFTFYIVPLRIIYKVWRWNVERIDQILKKKTLQRNFFFWYLPNRLRNKLWKPPTATRFSWSLAKNYQWKQEVQKDLNVRLSPDQLQKAQKIRIKMGLPISDWFVCLHVREAHFHKKVLAESQRARHCQNQNGTVERYIEGIQEITKAGGWVIRLGDRSMKPLPFSMDRVIDYPYTSFKSELMDLYLISHCRFYVGTNSGPIDLARLFQIPEIMVNLSEWLLAFPCRKGDLGITKHVFSPSQGRFLSLQEILSIPLLQDKTVNTRLGSNFLLFENTSEEIRDVIREFLLKLHLTPYSPLQETFNTKRREQVHHSLERFANNGLHSQRTLTEMARLAARCEAMDGALGQKFLEQNWLVDQLNEIDA